MIGERHTIARLQSDFYRDSYHKVLNGVFIEIFVLLILILAILYHIIVHPPQPFYASTLEGQILTLTPAK